MDEKNSVLISIDKLFKNQPEDQSDFEKDYDKMVDDISKKTKKNHKFRPLVVAKEGKKYRLEKIKKMYYDDLNSQTKLQIDREISILISDPDITNDQLLDYLSSSFQEDDDN